MAHRGKFRTKVRRKGKVMYAIRTRDGKFSNIESISRSSRMERKRHAKKRVKPQYGFRGDTK